MTINPSGTPVADSPATFTVSATATAPATIRTITVDWGDGSAPQTFPNTTAVAHTYRSAGPFTVTATAEDTNGGRSTGSTVVVVQASSPLVALAASSPVNVGATATFSVTITQNTANVPVESVTFNFGDGNQRPVQGLSTTHIYGAPGNYLASATVRFTNGRTARGEAAVRVN